MANTTTLRLNSGNSDSAQNIAISPGASKFYEISHLILTYDLTNTTTLCYLEVSDVNQKWRYLLNSENYGGMSADIEWYTAYNSAITAIVRQCSDDAALALSGTDEIFITIFGRTINHDPTQ